MILKQIPRITPFCLVFLAVLLSTGPSRAWPTDANKFRPKPDIARKKREAEKRHQVEKQREAEWRETDRFRPAGRGNAPWQVSLPRGFRSSVEFNHFRAKLKTELRIAGHQDTVAVLQGSAVTGRNYRNGQPFDVGRKSDFDIAICSPDLMKRAIDLGIPTRSSESRTKALSETQRHMLGLDQVSTRLSSMAGRNVNFMIYRSVADAVRRNPSIVFK